MSDRIGVQSKKTTAPTFTPPTVTTLTRGFTPQSHTAEPQAKTQVSSIHEVESSSSKQETPDLREAAANS